MNVGRWLLLVSLLALGSACDPADRSNDASDSTDGRAGGKPRVVEFQPGIRIDYAVPQVEVEAEVILRQGELELFAYSKAPIPKEHETILLLDARPQHIYESLGLIGLVEGNPMSYDWETQEITPPAGDPVDVLVRYASEQKGEAGVSRFPAGASRSPAPRSPNSGAPPGRTPGTIEESACNWMLDLARKAPMRHTHWLFAGSKKLEDGRFFADVDGTVVTVVNFDSALLALPELHTDSDAGLWLAANTDAIPPIGTRVTLILRPANAEKAVRPRRGQ